MRIKVAKFQRDKSSGLLKEVGDFWNGQNTKTIIFREVIFTFHRLHIHFFIFLLLFEPLRSSCFNF